MPVAIAVAVPVPVGPLVVLVVHLRQGREVGRPRRVRRARGPRGFAFGGVVELPEPRGRGPVVGELLELQGRREGVVPEQAELVVVVELVPGGRARGLHVVPGPVPGVVEGHVGPVFVADPAVGGQRDEAGQAEIRLVRRPRAGAVAVSFVRPEGILQVRGAVAVPEVPGGSRPRRPAGRERVDVAAVGIPQRLVDVAVEELVVDVATQGELELVLDRVEGGVQRLVHAGL